MVTKKIKIFTLFACSLLLASVLSLASIAETATLVHTVSCRAIKVRSLDNGATRQAFTSIPSSDNPNTSGYMGVYQTPLGAYPTFTGNFYPDFTMSSDGYAFDFVFNYYHTYISHWTTRLQLSGITLVDSSGNSHPKQKISSVDLNNSYWIEDFNLNDKHYFSTSSTYPFFADIDSTTPNIYVHIEFYYDSSFLCDKVYIQWQCKNIIGYTPTGTSEAQYEEQKGEEASTEANQQGDEEKEELSSQITSAGDVFSVLGNSIYSHNTSLRSWDFPAMYVPATSVTPRIQLSEAKTIDFNSWITKIPDSYMRIARGVVSAGLILFCGYELLDTLSLIFNNRKIVDGLSNDVDHYDHSA